MATAATAMRKAGSCAGRASRPAARRCALFRLRLGAAAGVAIAIALLVAGVTVIPTGELVALLAGIVSWSDAVRWDVVSTATDGELTWCERVDRFVIAGDEHAVRDARQLVEPEQRLRPQQADAERTFIEPVCGQPAARSRRRHQQRPRPDQRPEYQAGVGQVSYRAD